MSSDYRDEDYEEEVIYIQKGPSPKPKPKQELTDGQIIQRTGKIMPDGANGIKLVVNDKEVFGIIANTMSHQLEKHLYQEMMIQGKVTIAAQGEKKLAVMNYI